MTPKPDPTASEQERVWSFPPPAIAEPSPRRITIVHHGVTLADTRSAVRTLETSHPPSYCFPSADVNLAAWTQSTATSFREWKGTASYFDERVGKDVFWRSGQSFLVMGSRISATGSK